MDQVIELADEYRELSEELPPLEAKEAAAQARLSAARWWSRPRAQRAWDQLAGAVDEAHRRREVVGWLLMEQGAGAGAGWSALSVIRPVSKPSRLGQLGVGSDGGGPVVGLSLEETLDRRRDDLPEGEADRLLRALPDLRARAVLRGEGVLLDELHGEVVSLAGGVDAETAAALHEHLPADLRPLPETAEDLRRTTAHVRLEVLQPGLMEFPAWHLPEPDAIWLGDIVVHGKGSGLGTAVLTQLCHLADRDCVKIYGELEPGPRADPDDVCRLARWYARHGFTTTSGASPPPQRWRRGTRIVRSPRGSATRGR